MYGERLAVYIAIMVSSMLVGFAGGWKVQNWRFTSKIATIQQEHAKVAKDLADKLRLAEANNRQKETDMRALIDAEREKNRAQVRAIDKRLSDTLVELRNRPERHAARSGEVPSAPQTCAGVSGAELARGDGEFLAGYSADARKVREALRICETSYEAVRAELLKE